MRSARQVADECECNKDAQAEIAIQVNARNALQRAFNETFVLFLRQQRVRVAFLNGYETSIVDDATRSGAAAAIVVEWNSALSIPRIFQILKAIVAWFQVKFHHVYTLSDVLG